MNRRTLLAILPMALLTVLMMLATPNPASAQNQSCCMFTTFVGGTYPENCYPFTVLTGWSTGLHSFNVPGPGIYTNMVPAPCPPPPNFFWASFDGGISMYPLNFTGPVVIHGCNRMVSIRLDSNRCVQITIG